MPRATLHKARVVKNAAVSMASKPAVSAQELAQLVKDLADVVESLAMIVDDLTSRPPK
jgi:hypothetical protein